uniref:G_PROTEIN_RECEP_F1_2 domain-containing protein n=1 Tax=Panagrellus redivivus TaxID=6233 RepID=A0A7E4ZVN6_PANRE
MNNGTDPSLVINAKIAEIQSLIDNHKVRAEPNWTLEEDFAAFFAPYYLNVLSFNGSVTFVLHLLVWAHWVCIVYFLDLYVHNFDGFVFLLPNGGTFGTEMVQHYDELTYPQLEPIFESEYAFGYDVDYNPFLVYFFMLALFFILVILPIIEISCISMIVYQLKKVKHSISEKTYKLHKNLVIALIIQIMLPNVMIILPDILIIVGVWQGWKYMSFFTEVGIIMCSIHSVLDNFVMLVAITPYRQAVGRMISQQRSTVMTITGRLTSQRIASTA